MDSTKAVNCSPNSSKKNYALGLTIRANILGLLASEERVTLLKIAIDLGLDSHQIAAYHVEKLREEGLVEGRGNHYKPLSLTDMGRLVITYMREASTPDSIFLTKLRETFGDISESSRRAVAESAAKYDADYRWKGDAKDNSDGGLFRRESGKEGLHVDRKCTSEKVLEVIKRHHNYEQAAQELGIARQSLRDRVINIFTRAAKNNEEIKGD